MVLRPCGESPTPVAVEPEEVEQAVHPWATREPARGSCSGVSSMPTWEPRSIPSRTEFLRETPGTCPAPRGGATRGQARRGAAARPVRHPRRVLGAAVGQAGLHRGVRRHRAPGALDADPPAAVLPAPGGGPAPRPGVPSVLPDRPAHLLRRRVAHRPGGRGRLRPAALPGQRLPQERYARDDPLPGLLRRRPAAGARQRGARAGAHRGAPRANRPPGSFRSRRARSTTGRRRHPSRRTSMSATPATPSMPGWRSRSRARLLRLRTSSTPR